MTDRQGFPSKARLPNRQREEVERIRRLLKTVRELASVYHGTCSELSNLSRELDQVEELLRKDQFGEVGRKLTRLGVLCLAIPEPIASNLCGGILLTTGLILSKLDRGCLDWDALHHELHRNLHDLHRLKREIASLKLNI
ncbi:hypothetical protein DRO53_04310 [Candidatus Bathyarchaeota archaeon]|nr:MAG: hypothetical protein DRO46_00560 [Candidatus Hecatellales archaeon]RLI34152.1 MAG: hypothetical protein DRO53_04310 [Candidatus Bathyarchaeota archaeon]